MLYVKSALRTTKSNDLKTITALTDQTQIRDFKKPDDSSLMLSIKKLPVYYILRTTITTHMRVDDGISYEASQFVSFFKC